MASTSEELEGESSTKPTRKQGVSCDACKFRKVKCDRRTKIENRQGHESEENIACSVCSSHGLRCTYTQSAPRRRRGKRIVAIQKVQENDIDEALAIRSLQQNDPTLTNPYEPLFGSDFTVDTGLYDANQYANNHMHIADARTTFIPKDGLLGVRGLSRALLDACVKAYFKYSAPCTPILHAEVYAARYALFFTQYDKNKGVKPFWELPQEDATSMDRPLSELLLLSVGCIGAALLEPPIADFGSKAKFRLQDRLALRFQEVVNKHDLLLRLQHEGADVIEACYLMSDPMLTILGDDLPSRSTIDWNSVQQMDRSQRDPLRLRPASHEGIVRLIVKMGINTVPKNRQDIPPGDDRLWDCGGAFINEREVWRRSRIFWSIFMQDAFRAMGDRRNVLIGNDDYDMDLPRFMPDGDGWFTAQFFDKRDSDQEALERIKLIGNRKLQAAKFSKFDAYHFEVMLRLCFIIRTISVKFVSPRSRSKGVLVSDVDRAVSALTAWYQQLPSELTWEYQSEPLTNALSDGKTGSSNATAMRNSLRALFVECLYHGNVLAVWASVDVFGTRIDVDTIEALALLSSRLKIDEEAGGMQKSPDDVSTIKKSSKLDVDPVQLPSRQKEAEDVRHTVRSRLDNLSVRSFLRLSKVAREAAKLGLVRAHRGLFLNIFAFYAVWGCGLACKLYAKGGQGVGEGASALLLDVPPGYNQLDHIFKKVEDLIYAVGSVDSSEQAPEKVAQIRQLLATSRSTCQGDASTSSRSRSASASQSPQATTTSDESGAAADIASPHDAPFRYYFESRGNRGFGKRFNISDNSNGKRGSQQDFSSPTTMDTDEVAVLAHAAMPYDTGFSIEGPSPAPDVSFKSGDTPEANKAGITQDPTLDFNLETLSGMDPVWLHQYLQDTGTSQLQQRPQQQQQQQYLQPASHSAPSSAPAAIASFTNLDTTQPGFQQEQGQYYNQAQYLSPNDAFAHSIAQTSNTPAVDTQWDQFMANADAQLWADAQWQGFNVDSLMT